MNILLVWDGPLGAGRLPDDPAVLETLMQPGVYLRIRRYDKGRTVSYVGQSRNLLSRIDQHMTALLGLQYPLRDATGRVRFDGDFAGRLAAYGDVASAAALAGEEARRMCFFVARCGADFSEDRLNLVEGALKTRLEQRVAAAAASLSCDNRQGIPPGEFDDVVALESDTSGLGDDDRALIDEVLGTQPIEIVSPVSGDQFAE